jgi:hypothetical protein
MHRAQINEGMLLLGMVKEVREAEALISLPNNLTGWVEVDEVCPTPLHLLPASLPHPALLFAACGRTPAGPPPQA